MPECRGWRGRSRRLSKNAAHHPASSSEKEIYTTNALGQRTTKTDRNGNVHTYTFDVLGRQTSDAVTTLGSGVDGAVRRIEIGYDGQGNAFLFTTYDAASGGSVVNQVQREFNGLGQLTKEWQEHSGAVNTSTSPKVQYGYCEMASSANHSRLTGMTYPNGTVINYVYDSGLDSAISRLSSQSSGGTTLEAYSYLGMGTVVVRAHPQPGVDLTYVNQSGESNGDAGDQYTGLDRFGRVIDQRWRKTSDGSHTDRFQYGHDRNSNRLYRDSLLNDDFDELYHVNGASAGYDGLNQLTDWRRGPLSDTNSDGIPDTVTTASRSQGWDFDALGNWDSLSTNGTGESRTHNKQNQVTQVGSNNLSFDANGNLTLDEQGTAYTYDAWNRLVSADPSGPTSISYTHDALGRRVVENSGTAVDLYYSSKWQVLEERVSGSATKQYVWSLVYVDALVLRDRDTDANGSLDERLYAQQDANWNVTAVISTSGVVQERFALDAYGAPTFLNASWTTQSSSASDWVYLHQGGRWQTIGGTYHFRHRDMSVVLGRWINEDPLSYSSLDVNLYRYESDSPFMFVDPEGLEGRPNWPFEITILPNGQTRIVPNRPSDPLGKGGSRDCIIIFENNPLDKPHLGEAPALSLGDAIETNLSLWRRKAFYCTRKGRCAKGYKDLCRQLKEAADHNEQCADWWQMDRVFLYGHCGIFDGAPGVCFRNTKDGCSRFELESLTDDTVACIQKYVAPHGSIILGSCGYREGYGSANWENQLQLMANKLRRRVCAYGVKVSADGYICINPGKEGEKLICKDPK